LYKIVEKEILAPNIFSMDVLAPRVASSAKPGQFVIIIADETGERVTLSTIHGVKGLEFNNVILVNCRKDSMPHINSRENIEEERRLFYVGITRAADKLWILYPETCKGTQTEISPFIDECCMEFDIVKQ